MVTRLACLTVLLYIATLLLAGIATAAEAEDLAFIRKHNRITQQGTQQMAQEDIRFDLKQSSELKLIATGMIRLYQKFVSSQDSPACNFHPSCSRFAMACIQHYGVTRGLLLTADRLLRCNGVHSDRYRRDSTTGKHTDPVSDYAPEK